ncbi:MAG: hypothetical protein EBX65_04220, partial [Betaproteobacteria bacterium]|nr:hypothetical protein [Betaproteobacteria bacterium]
RRQRQMCIRDRVIKTGSAWLTKSFEEEERQLAAVWAHMKMCAFSLILGASALKARQALA